MESYGCLNTRGPCAGPPWTILSYYLVISLIVNHMHHVMKSGVKYESRLRIITCFPIIVTGISISTGRTFRISVHIIHRIIMVSTRFASASSKISTSVCFSPETQDVGSYEQRTGFHYCFVR